MGIRVIKSAVAAVLAVYIAHGLGLASPQSAGLLAILGVEVTKRKGIRSASARFAASVLGLFFSAFLFYIAGYHVWVIGVYVLTVFPLLSRVKLQDGIVTSTVVMLHLFSAQSITAQMLSNEIQLLLAGFGTATLVNVIYMPKSERHLQQLKNSLEEMFGTIFLQMAAHLRDHLHVWDGKELLDAEAFVTQGEEESRRLMENTLFQRDDYWIPYFDMRRQQLEAIERMLGLLARVYETLAHHHAAASLFDGLSEFVKQNYYTGRTEEQLHELEERFQRMPLPASRGEFEVRSALLQLLYELEAYLSIAKRLKRPQNKI